MAPPETPTPKEPPAQLLYAFYVLLFFVLIAVLVLAGVYGT